MRVVSNLTLQMNKQFSKYPVKALSEAIEHSEAFKKLKDDT